MAITLRRKPAGQPAPGAGPDGTTYPIPDPAKPSALLVPPFVLARLSEARTKRKVLTLVAAVVAVAALASAGAFAWSWSADRALVVANEEKKVADARVAKYLEVARYYDGLTAREAALTTALAGDVRYSSVTEEIYASAPGDLYPLNVKYAPGSPCAGPNPFTSTAALGCVEVNGRAESPQAVGRYVDELNKTTAVRGLLGGAFAKTLSSSSGGNGVEFSISVNYTLDALSYKFIDQVDTPTETEVAP